MREVQVNGKRALKILSLLMLLIVAACSSSANPQPGPTPSLENRPGVYQTLTIDEFAGIVSNQADAYTIINVHIPYEGEVPNTDAFVPYNDLDALTSALPDKNAPIVLYCRSGRMSEEASRALVERGYTQVWDVPGGMIAWQDGGREVLYLER